MSESHEKSAAAAAEEEMLELWAKEKTFLKSLKNREGCPYFSFYDGPPFANGLPHYGHVVPSTIKDAVARYKTMRGYYVPRVAGWDTHGLPVEYDVEKQLGLSGKSQILEMGVDKFNEACRSSVFRYKNEFEDFIRRLGRWVDLDNAYATLDDNYIESVWNVFTQIHKKGLLYKGFRSMPYCPRCATPLSNFELNQGYQDDVEDPSVFALFPLTPDSVKEVQQRYGWDAANKLDSDGVQGDGEQQTEPYMSYGKGIAQSAMPQSAESSGRVPGSDRKQDGAAQVYFLAWTTTPWTLPANAALAVDADADYAFVKLSDAGSTLILAKDRLGELDLRKNDYSLLKTVKGAQLVGLRYQPLYDVAEKAKFTDEEAENVWKVYGDDNVSLDDGTGILHVAPRYGETDLELGLREKLPLIESVDKFGHMTGLVPEVKGKFFKQADRHIIADLTHQGRIFAAETTRHTYPFCWRCDTPLMYFATPSWFVKVSAIRDKLVAANEQINWVPSHIKQGRFGNWLAEARDWGISRNRFWGAPLPVWQCPDGHYTVVGSVEELKQKAINFPEKLDMHRPGIDMVEIKCQQCGAVSRRIEEVFDCWFESGAMPYASIHYPFENQDEFEKAFPAEFISEGLDQTRGWFYTLHVLGTILKDSPAYKNVVCHGIVVAGDGRKLSKRLRNYPPLEEVFSVYGADILRFFMLNSPVVAGEEVRFSADHLRDTQRNIFMTLQNSFSFFKTYTEIDKWQAKSLDEPKSDHLLDQWMLARLNQTIAEVTAGADKYQLNKATRPLVELIDDMSNWYIRRSRRRFWKSENDSDKEQAYATLHYTLVRISQMMAPWAPFVSDRLWRELATGMGLPESVHLSDWPSVNQPDNASTRLLEDMAKVRSYIAEGLSQRASAGIKVRQPLSVVLVPEVQEGFREIIAEELNVTDVLFSKKLTPETPEKVTLKIDLTDELKAEGTMRELVRHIQNHRKKAGFNVADRINLKLATDSQGVQSAISRFKDTIYAETLAVAELTDEDEPEYSGTVKVDGAEVEIRLKRARG